MHQGVVRDMEQQRLKKERQLDFEMQKALEEKYKKVQSVHDGGIVLDKQRWHDSFLFKSSPFILGGWVYNSKQALGGAG